MMNNDADEGADVDSFPCADITRRKRRLMVLKILEVFFLTSSIGALMVVLYGITL